MVTQQKFAYTLKQVVRAIKGECPDAKKIIGEYFEYRRKKVIWGFVKYSGATLEDAEEAYSIGFWIMVEKIDKLNKTFGLNEFLRLKCREALRDIWNHNKKIIRDGQQAVDGYEDFIKAMAPSEIAYVALQRLTSNLLNLKMYSQAKSIFSKFKSLFPDDDRINDIIGLLDASSKRINDKPMKYLNTTNDEYNPVPTLDNKELFFCGFNRKDGFGGEDIFLFDKRVRLRETSESLFIIPSDFNLSRLYWTTEVELI